MNVSHIRVLVGIDVDLLASAAHSQDEEIGSFGLFDQDMEEERDEALALLMELREFKRQVPERVRLPPRFVLTISARPLIDRHLSSYSQS